MDKGHPPDGLPSRRDAGCYQAGDGDDSGTAENTEERNHITGELVIHRDAKCMGKNCGHHENRGVCSKGISSEMSDEQCGTNDLRICSADHVHCTRYGKNSGDSNNTTQLELLLGEKEKAIILLREAMDAKEAMLEERTKEIEELKSGIMHKDKDNAIARGRYLPGGVQSESGFSSKRGSHLEKRNDSATCSEGWLSHRDERCSGDNDLCGDNVTCRTGGDKYVEDEQRDSQPGKLQITKPRYEHDNRIEGQSSQSHIDEGSYFKEDQLCPGSDTNQDDGQSHHQKRQLVYSDIEFHNKGGGDHKIRDERDNRSEGRISHRDDRRHRDADYFNDTHCTGDDKHQKNTVLYRGKHSSQVAEGQPMHAYNDHRASNGGRSRKNIKPSKHHIWPSLKLISVFRAVFVALVVYASSSMIYFNMILDQTSISLPIQLLLENTGGERSVDANQSNRLGTFEKASQRYESEISKLLGKSSGYKQKNRMWAVKAALYRLDREVERSKRRSDYNSDQRKNRHSKKIGFFLQLGANIDLLPDLTMCLANVATATLSRGVDAELNLDLHVAVLDNYQMKGHFINQFFSNIISLRNGPLSVFTAALPNAGADTKTFLSQLHIAEERDVHYDIYLAVGAELDPVLRERMLESLCGTPEQVLSILAAMMRLSYHPTLLAPHGTAFGPLTPISEMFPHISRKYHRNRGIDDIFSDPNIQKINKLKQKLDGTKEDFMMGQMSMIAGSSFWVNSAGLVPKFWAKSKSVLKNASLTDSDIDVVIPSLILTLEDGQLLDIQPAPRPLAIYFPQYHQIPENDRFWGENFTEWTFLRDMKVPDDQPPLKKPLRLEEGGLGYYNLEDYNTRQRQADLAHKYGVQGFVFYHYWFSGDKAPKNHLVMGKIAEAMLRDGEPNVNFILSWANEPWTRRWDGGNKEVLLSQAYGDEDEWLDHYLYLLPFFKHERYIRVRGSPVFAIYRPEHIMDEVLRPMVDFWQWLSKERGDFPNGLHIVQTISALTKPSKSSEKNTLFDASFQFWPSYKDPVTKELGLVSSYGDFPLNVYPYRHMQYWGGFVGFDRRPRDPSDLRSAQVSPEKFRQGLCETSFPRLASYRNRNIATNFFFITAWNEWNEQSVLEPNAIDRFGYLQSLHHCLKNIPALPVKANNEQARQYEFCPTCSVNGVGNCHMRVKYLQNNHGVSPDQGRLAIMKEGNCLQQIVEKGVMSISLPVMRWKKDEASNATKIARDQSSRMEMSDAGATVKSAMDQPFTRNARYEFCPKCLWSWGSCNRRLRYLRDKYEIPFENGRLMLMKEGKCLQQAPDIAAQGVYVVWNGTHLLLPDRMRQTDDTANTTNSARSYLGSAPSFSAQTNDKAMRYEFCSKCRGDAWGMCGRRVNYLAYKYGTPPEMGKIDLMKEGKCLREVSGEAIGGTYVIRNGTQFIPAPVKSRQGDEVANVSSDQLIQAPRLSARINDLDMPYEFCSECYVAEFGHCGRHVNYLRFKHGTPPEICELNLMKEGKCLRELSDKVIGTYDLRNRTQRIPAPVSAMHTEDEVASATKNMKNQLISAPPLSSNDKMMRYEFCSECSSNWGNCEKRTSYLRFKYGTPREMGKLDLMKEGKCLRVALDGVVGVTYIIRNGTQLIPAPVSTWQEDELANTTKNSPYNHLLTETTLTHSSSNTNQSNHLGAFKRSSKIHGSEIESREHGENNGMQAANKAEAKRRRNTMIIATVPSSYSRIQAIQSQLECFTLGVDRIVLSAPNETWSRDALQSFASRLAPPLRDRVSLLFTQNDRYDAGLWCDALLEEEKREKRKDPSSPAGHGTNYLLTNDSLMATRKYDGLLAALKSERGNASLVSLNYWDDPNSNQLNWVESVARALSPRGAQVFRDGVCNGLAKAVAVRCAKLERKEARKRCIVQYAEIDVMKHFDPRDVRGLYPGMAPERMWRRTDMTLSWTGHYRFWKHMLVDKLDFPAVKITHGFLDQVPEKERDHLFNCTMD